MATEIPIIPTDARLTYDRPADPRDVLIKEMEIQFGLQRLFFRCALQQHLLGYGSLQVRSRWAS